VLNPPKVIANKSGFALTALVIPPITPEMVVKITVCASCDRMFVFVRINFGKVICGKGVRRLVKVKEG
jgi:hypothetical protein